MTALGKRINPLQPSAIGGTYGRSHTFTSRVLPNHPARIRVLALSIPLLVLLILVAQVSGVLFGPHVILAAFGFSFKVPIGASVIRLPLALDPVAIIFAITTLATPVCCAEQVASIASINSMISKNVAYRVSKLNSRSINAAVERANKRFDFIGRRSVSIFIFVLSAIGSFEIVEYIQRHGLLDSWNPTGWKSQAWRKSVYRGWWANQHVHILLALSLMAVVTFYVYHLIKQLGLGVVFAVYGRSVLSLGFGASPNLKLNVDGYNGRRDLRYFMQWTYFTTLVGYLLALGVFAVWLPFNSVAAAIIAVVIILNAMTVVYPSLLVNSAGKNEKKQFIEYASKLDGLSMVDLQELSDRVWNVPSIPFRIRDGVFAASIYLILPILLSYFSTSLR